MATIKVGAPTYTVTLSEYEFALLRVLLGNDTSNSKCSDVLFDDFDLQMSRSTADEIIAKYES